MPSQTNGSTKPRFELPALNLNFGSITDGTDIPPPPKSPVQEKTPEKPAAPKITPMVQDIKTEEKAATIQPETKAVEKPVQSNEGQKTNGQPASIPSRPDSRSGGSIMTEKKSRRTSGWFRRFTGGDSNKRASIISMDQPTTPTIAHKPTGPPPPMIPELKESDDGDLGADMFKNIR